MGENTNLETDSEKGSVPDEPEALVSKVREEYARIAERRLSGAGASCCTNEKPTGSERYGYASAEMDSLPEDADMGLGCGAPVASLDLRPGETVLDLGSGGGIDVFLAARQVGPGGRVIGVDMTPSMIELARDNARKGGYDNVDFREGRLESLPVADASIDAVTSNCVINLIPDKLAVFTEVARVLRPRGRLVISDIVLDGELPEALRREMSVANCVTTAMQRDAYLETLARSGLGEIEVLRDVDYLAVAGWTSAEHMNEESRALLERAGVEFEDVRGKVRSITLRAVKPAR